MGFDKRAFDAADTELEAIRRRNERTVEMREAEIRQKHPEIYAMQKELSGTLAKLLLVIADRDADISGKLAALEKKNTELQSSIKEQLIKCGYPGDYLDPIYSCPVCKDTGVVEGRRCKCYMDIVKRAASDEMNRSSPLRLSSFDEFSLKYYDDSTPVAGLGATARKVMEYDLNVCRQYAEEFHLPYRSLLFRGRTGLGKTHLSLSIAAAVLDKGYSVVYGSAPDIFRMIEREHFGNADADRDTLGAVIRTDLLVLDDLGAEFETKFYSSALYNIINDRMNVSLPTIVSTNLEHPELEQRYGERTYSRLSTMDELIFAGSDVRVKKAAQQ